MGRDVTPAKFAGNMAEAPRRRNVGNI